MEFKECNDYIKCGDNYYRYVYVIICTNENYKDNFYIGKHKSRFITNTYAGSGTLIKQYIKEHPNEYCKIILGTYNNDKEQREAELYYINKYINNPLCLNMNKCSSSGFENHTHTEQSIEKIITKRPKRTNYVMSDIGKYHIKNGMIEYYKDQESHIKASNASKQNWIDNRDKMMASRNTPEFKEKCSNALKRRWEDHDFRNNIKEKRKYFRHKEETKKQISLKMSGENNPMYGTTFTWMNNGITRKRVDKSEVYYYIKLGYRLGTKLK